MTRDRVTGQKLVFLYTDIPNLRKVNKIKHKSTSGNSAPESQMNALLSDSPPVRNYYGTDKEFFIRQAFEDDAVKGYDLLFRHYYAALCSHAVRYVYTKEIAEDLVADVFYTFWKKENFKQIATSYRSYLFTAVRHKCFNYLRWEFSKDNGVELEEAHGDSSFPQPDHIMEYDELCVKLEKTIESLPPQCKKVFLMNRFEGRNYNEIAQNMGVSIKAVEAHISKALVIFRRALLAHYKPGLLMIILLSF